MLRALPFQGIGNTFFLDKSGSVEGIFLGGEGPLRKEERGAWEWFALGCGAGCGVCLHNV